MTTNDKRIIDHLNRRYDPVRESIASALFGLLLVVVLFLFTALMLLTAASGPLP